MKKHRNNNSTLILRIPAQLKRHIECMAYTMSANEGRRVTTADVVRTALYKMHPPTIEPDQMRLDLDK